MGSITPPDYPTLFFFEAGEWWDYAMLLVVIAALAFTAWLAQRNMWVVLAVFVVIPVALTIFWWPHSTLGTASAGWFPIVKQYSALAGSLCLVALQVFPRLRHNRWYLLIPPVILSVNIAEAVVRDFQCYGIHGVDPSQGMVTWGGPWNIMNGIAGILNLLAISGWIGIFVSKGKERALVWGRPDDRVDYRLRPVEFRLRLQLSSGPRVVLGRGTVGGVYDSGSHEVWARRVDPVPGLHADFLVGCGAHFPAFHAGLDVRAPQRAQPKRDVHHLRGRATCKCVGFRPPRVCNRLKEAQSLHAGGSRR